MIIPVEVKIFEKCALEDIWYCIHCTVQGCYVAQVRPLPSFTSLSALPLSLTHWLGMFYYREYR